MCSITIDRTIKKSSRGSCCWIWDLQLLFSPTKWIVEKILLNSRGILILDFLFVRSMVINQRFYSWTWNILFWKCFTSWQKVSKSSSITLSCGTICKFKTSKCVFWNSNTSRSDASSFTSWGGGVAILLYLFTLQICCCTYMLELTTRHNMSY